MVTRLVFRTATAVGLATSVLCMSACGLGEVGDAPGVAEPQPDPGGQDPGNDTKLLPQLEGEPVAIGGGAGLTPGVKTGDDGARGQGSACEERRPPHATPPTRPGDRFARAALVPACRDDGQVGPVPLSPIRAIAPPEALAPAR